MTKTAVVDARGATRARRGHPWIYSDNVLALDAAPGDLVRVLDREQRWCCWAVASPHSKISLRRVRAAQATPDRSFWHTRLNEALALRGPRAVGPEGCTRLLHADADGFPGLTIDRYGPHLVVQATTAWADREGPALAAQVATQVGAISILSRGDAQVRELEGLQRAVVPWQGVTPETIEVEAGGVGRIVDPYRGHKTGLYLDQQDNQRAALGWLRGEVLDLFCGEGGFALPLALAGHRVTAVDSSRPGLERADAAANQAGVSDRIEWVDGDVFDWLHAAERERRLVDAVILDPPPFARRRAEVEGGLRGYRDLHRRALRLLRPGGRLLSFSCSFNVSPEAFEGAAREAAAEAQAIVRLLGRPGAAADHPELLELPESRYLKGLLLERLSD